MKKILFLISISVLFFQSALLAQEERYPLEGFPSSPQERLIYNTFTDDRDDSIKFAFWNENETLYLYVEPITESFLLDGLDFAAIQNGTVYRRFDVDLYDESGDEFHFALLRQSIILECHFCDFSENCLDLSQSFEFCFDDNEPYENCFTINPSGRTAKLSFDYKHVVSVGTQVTFEVSLDIQCYYEFFLRTGYGTASYGDQPWQPLQNYSTSNTCTYTFNSAGHYIVVCHIKESLADTSFETVGFSIKVE